MAGSMRRARACYFEISSSSVRFRACVLHVADLDTPGFAVISYLYGIRHGCRSGGTASAACGLRDPVAALAGRPAIGQSLPALRCVRPAQPLGPGRVQVLAVGPEVGGGARVGAQTLTAALGARGAPLPAVVGPAESRHVVTPAADRDAVKQQRTTAALLSHRRLTWGSSCRRRRSTACSCCRPPDTCGSRSQRGGTRPTLAACSGPPASGCCCLRRR